MSEKEQEQFQTQEDFFQAYPEYMTQSQMIQEIKDLSEKVKENQSLRKRIQEQDEWIKKLESGEVRTESIARLEKELHQQKFNNKHNLSIDGEVSRKIEELNKELSRLNKENFALSAGQCCAKENGISFEEGTSLFCKYEEENKNLKKEIEELKDYKFKYESLTK